jgi:DNA-binding response OmpR family regulator
LVVDDDERVRVVLCALLEKQGYHIRIASDNSSALMNVAFNGPALALVVLDMKMPGLDGERTLQGIRALHADLPCLVYSAYCEQAAMERMQLSGYFDFLAKPSTMKELLAKIASMLRNIPAAIFLRLP